MSVRAMLARVQRLEQARQPSIYATVWAELADEVEAEINGGCADPDKSAIVASLRRWVRDGADTLWLSGGSTGQVYSQ